MTPEAPSTSARDTTTLAWPTLSYEAWKDTYATLHRWTQIVGKTRLALAPMVNHWWQATFLVTARGLTTTPVPDGLRTFEVEFDLVDHRLWVRTSDGAARTMALAPRSVADFYREYRALLEELGIRVKFWPMPVEIENPVRFPDDHAHAAYDAAAVTRFFQALTQADRVLEIFRGRFLGKTSPVHFFWGSFDLACTRFSGRRAPTHPGGLPNLSDWVTREAYSHECASAGFWPGGGPVTEAVFYAYAYPEPAGYRELASLPTGGRFDPTFGEFLIPYEAVRTSSDPDATLLEFLQRTYENAADRAGWDRAQLERSG